jgi:rhodanese-related sulfurtransferase
MDIIDVRDAWEIETSGTLENAIHIPMDEVPERMAQISKVKPVVIICHTGRRSSEVSEWLSQQGYTNILNLTGGIHRWAMEIDPNIQMY